MKEIYPVDKEILSTTFSRWFLQDAHVKSVKHTGLVRIILWIDLFVTMIGIVRRWQGGRRLEWYVLHCGGQMLNRQTFKALPASDLNNLTSLLGRFFAGSALNVWRFNIGLRWWCLTIWQSLYHRRPWSQHWRRKNYIQCSKQTKPYIVSTTFPVNYVRMHDGLVRFEHRM